MLQNKYWLIALVYCLLPVLFAVSLSLFIRRLPDTGQPRSDEFIWISKNHPVDQDIYPGHDGLNVVTIYLKNVGLRNQKPLFFYLLQNGKIIRRISLNGYNVGDGDSVRFQFSPITDSAGQTFQIRLESPGTDTREAIGVGVSSGNISYQTYYFPTLRIQVLQAEVNGLVKSVLDFKFLAAFLILFVFCAGLIVCAVSFLY